MLFLLVMCTRIQMLNQNFLHLQENDLALKINSKIKMLSFINLLILKKDSFDRLYKTLRNFIKYQQIYRECTITKSLVVSIQFTLKINWIED